MNKMSATSAGGDACGDGGDLGRAGSRRLVEGLK